MFRKIFNPIYVFYVATLFISGLLVVFTLSLIISIGNTLTTRKIIFRLIEAWSRVTLFMAGAPVKVTGKPKGGRYVVIANHISYLDAIDIFSARPDYFKALGKTEIAKAPLFGYLYKQEVILVDRSSPESRAESMRKMTHFLKTEGNIFIYPEGTFNETGEPLKEFYDGAFRLAIAAQTPILPVVFPDTEERWHHKHWREMWPGRNRCMYLTPISVDGMTQDDLPALKEQAHKAMSDAIAAARAIKEN